jgi:O-acetyl-ADP-ribose deacetylase (regulator of RNase III)
MRPTSDRLSVVQGDITELTVDAIVNAANSRLVPGGGVDGAINKAAGPELGAEMMAIGRCRPGEAVITPGFRLSARHVIHTVAPVYAQHQPDEVWRLLANCYRNSLDLAVAHNIRSIAFPCLGTGVYEVPASQACATAVATAVAHCSTQSLPEQVIFCCFGKPDADLYRAALARLSS